LRNPAQRHEQAERYRDYERPSADDRDLFAPLDLHVDAAKHLKLPELLVQAFDLQQRPCRTRAGGLLTHRDPRSG
jgi:hypothetical protein